MKSKTPGSGRFLYDLIFDALDESQIGRGLDFGGATAFEVARRIRAKDQRFDDFEIENALEELAKTGVVKKMVPPPVFSKEQNTSNYKKL